MADPYAERIVEMAGRMAALREERGEFYGDPVENHRGIAMMWAPILQLHWQAV